MIDLISLASEGEIDIVTDYCDSSQQLLNYYVPYYFNICTLGHSMVGYGLNFSMIKSITTRLRGMGTIDLIASKSGNNLNDHAYNSDSGLVGYIESCGNEMGYF